MTDGAGPDPDSALAALRSEIDEADRALVALLARRRAIVERMRALKVAHGLPRVDRAREEAVRRGLETERARLGVPGALLDAVLAAVLEDSRALVTRP